MYTLQYGTNGCTDGESWKKRATENKDTRVDVMRNLVFSEEMCMQEPRAANPKEPRHTIVGNEVMA